jgi:hypothetical protein
MFTRTMKWLAIAALVWLLVVLWRSSANYSTILAASAVWAVTIVLLVQAIRAESYIWAATFIAVVALFNPIWPVMFARKVFLWLDAACILVFLTSLWLFKAQPRLSLLSITELTPRGESL